jgi:hypothetical protein
MVRTVSNGDIMMKINNLISMQMEYIDHLSRRKKNNNKYIFIFKALGNK